MHHPSSSSVLFINGWHPKIAHDKLARWQWLMYDKCRSPETDDTIRNVVKLLMHKQIVVLYIAKNGNTRDHFVCATYAGPSSMRVRKQHDPTEEYTMSYSGIVSIAMHVEYNLR